MLQLPETGAGFELKSGLIHLLPKFDELSGEDPNKHLTEFHIVYASMKPAGVIEEQIALKTFPFSLANSTKEWLYYLPSRSAATWIEMTRQFLEKYFPATKATAIPRKYAGFDK